MTYIGGVVMVVVLVLPLILLYKLWYGRRILEDTKIDNDNEGTIRLTDSTSVVDDSFATSDSTNPSSSFPSLRLIDSTSVVDTPFVISNFEDTTNSFPSVEYEVFLSFRGPDTRNQITDILYRFLCRTKIHTFKDDNELRKGEEIGSNLLQAIDQSKIYVPIISKNYAHSKWCLIELAEIIRRQEQDTRRIILPIFYMVDPRDVRHQTGPYLNAFQEHGKKFDQKTIQSWKDALNKVGALKGWHVKSNDEQGVVADEVSADLWSRLSTENLTLETGELVGIDDHVEAIVEKLSLDSKCVIVVGLHGMGGIGKTTIAKAVYNNISSRFNRCCFVENVRETQGHEDGVVALQKKLVSEILRMGSIGFTHDSGGRKMIKERVSRFKSLIVFDDVDEKFKFHDVLGSLKDFTSESRFIITSRNERVLSTLGENECRLYEVGSMSQSRSLELFSKHAFKMNSPPPDYKTLANDIVLTTGGLPLTLKVIGSLLYREEIAVWKDKLEQLHETLELEVLDRLKISYDSLAYEAQQIFLDIACFFIGENKEMSSYMWTDCRFYPASNIKILIQRSMIKVGNKDEFQMHDQLRDMGAEIVRREDIERPWMRSRIWSTKDGIELLSNIKGSSQVKAISLDSVFSVKSDLESVYFYNLPELRYFYATNILFFTKITKTMFTGDFSNLLPNLRWLQLHQYSHSEEDDHHLTNFILKNLVILILEDCRITNDWGGWSHIKMAERLKVVKLSKCYGFTRLPELPRNIEVLSIRGIKYKVNIQELDILFKKKKKELDIEYIQELDIEELNKLKALVLSKICIGKISGGTFGMLKELEELDLNYLECSNLREAVADVGQLTSLKILRTAGAKEVEYDCPLGLKELYTSSWISSLAELLELEVLRVYGCEDGLDIPLATSEDQDSVWWKVSKLKYLFLTGTKINNNVSDHGGGGRFLLPTSLISLRIRKCHEPTSLIFPSMENLKNLTRLEVDDVLFQTHLDGLEGLRSLETLFINNVSGLTKIKGLRDLLCSSTCKLESLQISSCLDLNELVTCELDQTVLVPSLQCLSIGPCPHLDVGPVIRGLSKFPTLKKLALIKVMITKEEDLEVIGTLEELDTLELELYPSSLERIPSLSKLKKLESLTLSLPSLRDIEGLGELKSLKELCLQNCESLERLWLEDHHPQLCSLGTLNIRNCKSLSVDHLSALKTSLPPGVAITWPDHFRNQRRGRGRRGRRQL